jgi:hypothetical protein
MPFDGEPLPEAYRKQPGKKSLPAKGAEPVRFIDPMSESHSRAVGQLRDGRQGISSSSRDAREYIGAQSTGLLSHERL